MKMIVFILILLIFPVFSQQSTLVLKLDSATQKYGFVNSNNDYIISPTFDEANEFISPYTSVKIDTLWGIIDTLGVFKIKPKYNRLSAVYRDYFLEYGTKNYKFRSIDGSIKYDYLFIPGPFKMILDSIPVLGLESIPDLELLLRVLKMGTIFCHYYQHFRIYNSIALYSPLALKWTVDYVLDNPAEVVKWINNDKKYEEAYKNGEVDCCGSGPVWYGSK